MTRQEIENVICDIMINDGPDRHVDGYELIADFVIAVVNNKGAEWANNYLKNVLERKEMSLSDLISKLPIIK